MTALCISPACGNRCDQCNNALTPEMGQIAINPEEWPTLRDAIDRMIAECRPINA